LSVPKTCRNGRQDCRDFGTADSLIHVSRNDLVGTMISLSASRSPR
jgi:hypothetical protein